MELATPSHHPNPLPNTHHRKIELQSPLDLEYLRNNLLLSAQQKLDLNLPPSALRKPPAQPATFISLDGPQRDASSSQQPPTIQPQTQHPPPRPSQDDLEDDPLRTRVQSLLAAFLARTWSSASHSITINGLDASFLPHTLTSLPTDAHTNACASQHPPNEREGLDFTYHPYDARLQTHLTSLYGELESLTAQVSKLRREAPITGAQNYSQSLRAQIAVDEQAYEGAMLDLQQQHEQHKLQQRTEQREQQKALNEQTENAIKLDPPRVGYYDDMQATYTRGVEELARLAGVANRNGGSGGGGGSSPRQQFHGAAGGGSLTETMGKVQRAKTVALEFE